MTRKPAVRTRVLVFSLILVTLTLIGHAGAEGSLPDRLGLALMVVLGFVLASVVMSRKRSTAVVLFYLIGGQAALHGAATVTSAHSVHVSHGNSVSMVSAHLILALLATIAVQRMESIVDAFVSLARTILGHAVRVVPLPLSTATIGVRFPTSLASLLDSHAYSLRGPPALTSCA